MYRNDLLSLLLQHKPSDEEEARMTQDMLAFVRNNPDCFERSLLKGHITASAWVVSPDRKQVLLIHHRKLNRWLQPGGHADGDPNVAAVALREAQEETGLSSIRLVSTAVFDVDIHTIPARNEVPEHLHYDVRFLLEADSNEPFGNSDEITNIQWFSLKKAEQLVNSPSILRMLRKK